MGKEFIQIPVSIGVASYVKEMKEIKEIKDMIAIADKGLYRTKTNAINQICT
ncbi:MAG: hypothetical protein QNJ68_07390 [Microcoleaceae cyanobacterium MO_207.B10]|nr:hypothetical protein [Microcoleaceae cyanobacterium MO_207.B10]